MKFYIRFAYDFIEHDDKFKENDYQIQPFEFNSFKDAQNEVLKEFKSLEIKNKCKGYRFLSEEEYKNILVGYGILEKNKNEYDKQNIKID